MAKIFLFVLFGALLVSCNSPSTPVTLEGDQFYAMDFTNDSYYKVAAEILVEGEKCVIWAEKGSGIDKTAARGIAYVYDTVIRPRIVDAFGMKNINKNITVNGETVKYNFNDILDYANWLAGKENRKLTVLLLDIKDGFKDPATDPYIAGYFFSGNFLQRDYGGYSNGCDMIYMDTYPGLRMRSEQTYATFSHELQHLINYATSKYLERRPMDTWIDEGLSSQAEHIYFGKNIEDKGKWFSEDNYGTIAKGNNFFVWDNHPEESMAILDEYATVYMFFRWLYLQADSGLKKSIFLDIATSNLSDHGIITGVAKGIRSEWADWDALLGSWLAANYYPKNAVDGYKGDSFFQETIRITPIQTKDNTISLYPGEGVYSVIRDPYTPPANGAHIRYAELTKGASKVMLTFNANTDNDNKTARPETGELTGISPPGSRIRMVVGEDIQTEKTPVGSYVIDARDASRILGRDK